MNSRLTIAFCSLLLLCAFLAGQVVGQNQPGPQAPGRQVDRYRGFGTSHGAYAIDTATGELYGLSGRQWMRLAPAIKP